MKGKRLRGVTLLEMTICLAVITILSTMTVTFCALVSLRAQTVTSTYTARSQFELIKISINSYCSNFDTQDYTWNVTQGELSATKDGEDFKTYSFNSEEQTVYCKFATSSYTRDFNHIVKVTFELQQHSEEKEGALLIVYVEAQTKPDETTVFQYSRALYGCKFQS